jgi:hypothetical protein
MLTGTAEATEHRKLLERRNRFLVSRRWKEDRFGLCLQHVKSLQIELRVHREGHRIHINGVAGKKFFPCQLEAKMFVFELIQSGTALEFAKKHPQRRGHS